MLSLVRPRAVLLVILLLISLQFSNHQHFSNKPDQEHTRPGMAGYSLMALFLFGT